MKGIFLTGPGRIETVECRKPSLKGEGEVLLQVHAVGVCGSDIHYFKEGRIGDQVVRFPYRIGHEFCATVVEAGKAVRHLAVGDRVAVDPAISCGVCDQCRAGRPHTCRELLFLGCPGQVEGCLAEFLVMPGSCCFKIPDRMSVAEGVLVEPVSIGVYAVSLAGQLRATSVGILGCGPIGLSVLSAARSHSVGRIYVSEPLDYRREFAAEAGADWVGDPFEGQFLDHLCREEPLSLDVVFECCGRQEALDQALLLLKPGGTLVLVGIPPFDRISFGMDDLRRKEITIRNVRRQNDCMERAIGQVASNPALGRMVTHQFGIDRAQDAFETVSSYRDKVIKALVVF